MRSKKVAAIAVMVSLGLLLAGCVPFPSRTVISPSGHITADAIVGTWTTGRSYGTPEQPFVNFARNGTWTASDGCDRVHGTWRVETNGSFNTIAGPQIPTICAGNAIPNALLRASGVSVRDGALSLRSWDNAPTLTLMRANDKVARSVVFPIGYWAEEATPDAPFLAIRANGTYSGSNGCNTLIGTWVSRGSNAVRLVRGGSTLKACDDTDTWLEKAVLGTANGGTLTLRDQGGVVIGHLSSLDHSQG